MQPERGDACSKCKGRGDIWIGYPPRVPCPDCRGTGRRVKFGDLLRYPDDQGVGDDILFMFLNAFQHGGETYHNVMVVRTTDDDDQWVPGSMVTAGREELIPYVEPGGAKIFIDGKEISSEAVFAGIDIAAGSSAAVFGIRDASGTFTITDVKVKS